MCPECGRVVWPVSPWMRDRELYCTPETCWVWRVVVGAERLYPDPWDSRLIGEDGLRLWRLNRGWTQAQCADACDVSVTTWARWERGATIPAHEPGRRLAVFVRSHWDKRVEGPSRARSRPGTAPPAGARSEP